MVVTSAKFKFVAGTPCLDFVNTVGGRVASQGTPDYADRVVRDKLANFSDLLEWGQAAGLLDRAEAAGVAIRAEQDPAAARGVWERALGLREALYRICKSGVEGWPPQEADFRLLREELAAARAHQRLQFSRGRYVWDWSEPEAPERPLWAIVRQAGDFLASPDLAALRQCPGDACGWMFLDTSRNHSRRWCQMRMCGNRAKLRRFRRRG